MLEALIFGNKLLLFYSKEYKGVQDSFAAQGLPQGVVWCIHVPAVCPLSCPTVIPALASKHMAHLCPAAKTHVESRLKVPKGESVVWHPPVPLGLTTLLSHQNCRNN